MQRDNSTGLLSSSAAAGLGPTAALVLGLLRLLPGVLAGVTRRRAAIAMDALLAVASAAQVDPWDELSCLDAHFWFRCPHLSALGLMATARLVCDGRCTTVMTLAKGN